jgi:D-alanine-D-alanine ligase
MSKHVAVLMGGWSAEREISLRSGKACAEAATRLGYRVTRIDVGRDIATVLSTVKPDVALNVLHGRPGEDGTLQGILEILAIPYSHSGVMSSAVAMQKDVA